MSRFRTRELKQLMFETEIGIRTDEIDPLIQAWILGNDLNAVAKGFGHVMSDAEIVQYLENHCLTLFNNFEDDDIGAWTIDKGSNQTGVSAGNTSDDKIYGLKEGFMAIAGAYTLGVGQWCQMGVQIPKRTYQKVEWWMKYSSGTPQLSGTTYVIALGLGTLGAKTFVNFLTWVTSINVGWKKYRAIIQGSGTQIDRLDNGAWVNLVNGGGFDTSTKDYLWFEIITSVGTTNTSPMSAQFDGMQIYGSVS